MKQRVECGLALRKLHLPYEGPVQICTVSQFILTDAQSMSTALDLGSQGPEDHFVPWFSHGTNVIVYTLLCTRFYGAKLIAYLAQEVINEPVRSSSDSAD